MKQILPTLLLAASVAACSPGGPIYSSESYNSDSDQGRILSDILEKGQERVTRTGDGKRVRYLARDFFDGNKRVVAHAVTYIWEGHGNGLPGFKRLDAEFNGGNWYFLKPNIAFEVFEQQGDNYKITYVMDDLLNNPDQLEDFVVVIQSKDNKFILPHNIPKSEAKVVSDPELYKRLVNTYKKEFL